MDQSIADPRISSNDPVEEDPLPAGWKAYTASNGKIYYANASTGQTQWNRPIVQSTEAPSSRLPATSTNPSASKALPEGWKEYRSAEGKVYYAHTITKKTQWDFPMEDQSTVVAAMPRYEEHVPTPVTPESAVKRKRSDLEIGAHEPSKPISTRAVVAEWTQYHTTDGKVYYFDAASGKTSWVKPEDIDNETIHGSADHTALPDAFGSSTKQGKMLPKSKRRKTQSVARPRDPATNETLSDREAERYFIESWKQKRGKFKDDGMKISIEAQNKDQERNATFASVSERLKAKDEFIRILLESGVNLHASWITAVSLAVKHPRYTTCLPTYGLRRQAYETLMTKLKKKSRLAALQIELDRREQFDKLLDEKLSETRILGPNTLGSLNSSANLLADTIKKDVRHEFIKDENIRICWIRSFVGEKAREIQESQRNSRRRNMRELRSKLDGLGLGTLPDGKPIRPIMASTSFHTIRNYLESESAYLELSEVDRRIVYDDWVHDTRKADAERRAAEREKRKQYEKDIKAAFRTEVRKLLASGTLGIFTSLHEAKDWLIHKSWYQSVVDTGASVSFLWDDIMEDVKNEAIKYQSVFDEKIKLFNVQVTDNGSLDVLLQNWAEAETSTAWAPSEMHVRVLFDLAKDRKIHENRKKEKVTKERTEAFADFVAKKIVKIQEETTVDNVKAELFAWDDFLHQYGTRTAVRDFLRIDEDQNGEICSAKAIFMQIADTFQNSKMES